MKAQGKLNLGRRQFFRVLGAGTAAGTVGPLAAVATETVETAKKRRARYQANSPEVQTFYRVNRYPAK
ncbi:MAG TPA: formate dehydrogenase [Xanthobacteraceae bacterium]|nr:formate dehydrogenase [Xanthobacteraceae bacterium]